MGKISTSEMWKWEFSPKDLFLKKLLAYTKKFLIIGNVRNDTMISKTEADSQEEKNSISFSVLASLVSVCL